MQAQALSHESIQSGELNELDTRSLRIALLGYRSNPFSGGQGVYLKYLSRALVKLGHSVDVISAEPYPELDDTVGLIKLPGLNLFESPNHLWALRPKHLLSATDMFEWASMASGGFPEPFAFGRRLKRYLKNARPGYDIIHDNQSLCHALLSIQQAYPVLTTIHHPITSDRDIALSNAQDWSERLLIKRWHYFLRMQIKVASQLPAILTVSRNSKQDLSKDFRIPAERIRVVYNGIDTDDFFPMRHVASDTWQLITTASADQPLKGTRHLLKAFAALLAEYPKLRLTIIGALKSGGENEKLIKHLGIQDRITQRSQLSTSDIRHLYAQSSIAIVPSDYEGFGLPAGEAMACGLPVVSTDGGALPEVLGDAGIVVPAKKPIELARAIKKLLENPPARASLASRGLERIRTHFCWNRAANETVNFYRHQIHAHRVANG